MILIADSGSTKCDWALIGWDTDIRITTDGINPFFCTIQQIEQIIETQLFIKIKNQQITKIFFFGAGCYEGKKDLIIQILSRYFSNADIIVDSDLKAAATALFGDASGIACILGTGSNSCLYEAGKIIHNVSPLGYIIGDEGSGAVLGKKFLGDCLKNQIPHTLQSRFFDKYKLTTFDIIENLYRKPFPNRFLAGFAPFLKENIAEPYVYNLVFNSFIEFFQKNIMQYADYQNYQVSFCGSVAYHFADVLKDAAYEKGLNLGKIIVSPIDSLIEVYRLTF